MNDVCITNGVICMYKTVNLKLSYLQNQPIKTRRTKHGLKDVYKLSMVASPIYTVLKCSCFFYQVLFHG